MATRILGQWSKDHALAQILEFFLRDVSQLPHWMVIVHLSPLRWAGSKRPLLGQFENLLPRQFATYVEPFAGSASLFFRIAPPKAVLGDINGELVHFFQVLKTNPQGLLRGVRRIRRSGKSYYDIRELEPSKLSDNMAAARFYYLNRKCFNGVYRTNRRGQFNVPEGKNTGGFHTSKRLRNAAELLGRARLVHGDFVDTIMKARRGDFVYMDPPYARRRSRKPGEYGYHAFDGDVDIERLSAGIEELNVRGVKYMLSYMESAPLMRSIAFRWRRCVRVMRNVGGYKANRRFAREVIVGNYDL